MTTPEPTTEPVEPTVDDPAAVDPSEQDDGKTKPGAEAARYRRQLRDTEAERDSLRERITGYERGEAERLAAAGLADPTDMWAGGVRLDDLRGEDGQIDPEKVAAAVSTLTEQRPHWRRPTTPRPDMRQGGGHADCLSSTTPWHEALSNRHRS
ncbi:hypothetical protein [Nocardia flavorosea]|uniref:Uncharacterized protein n=1 Tax=Nocardia flavorosea TaxID=53429 RepID=A0A846YK01_9NOCA|nr:hypothetical protein [Nocardia flavorosea]NKY57229.1 hypothetical protein [Nocardia flavorosea]